MADCGTYKESMLYEIFIKTDQNEINYQKNNQMNNDEAQDSCQCIMKTINLNATLAIDNFASKAPKRPTHYRNYPYT